MSCPSFNKEAKSSAIATEPGAGTLRTSPALRDQNQSLEETVLRDRPRRAQHSGSAVRRRRGKGRRTEGTFLLIPHALIDSPNFQNCGSTAIKLLVSLARQYNGANNGDLAPALVKWGPASEAKTRALRELKHYGLISQDAHDEDRDLVISLIAKNAYRKKASQQRLWTLWVEDFAPVSAVKEPELAVPSSLEELAPFLDRSIEKFNDARKQVLVVNGHAKHRDDMPDFDKEDVWNILVGGAKLSRGFTVEGLTVSYFLRKTAAGDTLMQMGRWFGFRRGYRDLVRLYIGTHVSAGNKGTSDLYEMFESICMDEERFRKRIAIYSEQGIRPIQVPPLVPMGMLLPTQKNKMYNAEIQMENFGGKVAESGRVPFMPADRRSNAKSLTALFSASNAESVELVGFTKDGVRRALAGHIFSTNAQSFLAFIQSYRWGTQQSQFSSVIGFLQGTGAEDPQIDSWLVAVLANPSAKRSWSIDGINLGVFERGVVNERFKVFSESRHRDIANHLTQRKDKNLIDPSNALTKLTKQRQGVCLVYPTVPSDYDGKQDISDSDVTIGLCLTFPENSIRQTMNWRVIDPTRNTSLWIDQNCAP